MDAFLLPPVGEIVRRLMTVSDEPYNVEKLYQPIAKRAAGTERSAVSLVLLFELAIADVTDRGGLPPLVEILWRSQVSAWLRALVDDEAVLAEALAELAALEPQDAEVV